MPRGSLQKPSFSIAFIISSKTKKYFFALTFYKATWLAYRARWFRWVTAIRITLIVFKLTNLWLNALIKGQVYPWVRRWRLILLVHIFLYPSCLLYKNSFLELFARLQTRDVNDMSPNPFSWWWQFFLLAEKKKQKKTRCLLFAYVGVDFSCKTMHSRDA